MPVAAHGHIPSIIIIKNLDPFLPSRFGPLGRGAEPILAHPNDRHTARAAGRRARTRCSFGLVVRPHQAGQGHTRPGNSRPCRFRSQPLKDATSSPTSPRPKRTSTNQTLRTWARAWCGRRAAAWSVWAWGAPRPLPPTWS
jgi:hypothetical protein